MDSGHDRPMQGDRAGLMINSALTIPEAELSWRFSRSSGPGGQGVNTTDSRVELTWDIGRSAVLTEHQRARLLQRLSPRLVDGRLTVTASEHRAQLRNRDAARARLTALVLNGLKPPARSRRPTKPTRAAQQRRIDAKKNRGQTKRLRRPPFD
jgi:ribosome-associated protein